MISVILRSSFFFVLATLHSIWDFSLLARDRTEVPCIASVEAISHVPRTQLMKSLERQAPRPSSTL